MRWMPVTAAAIAYGQPEKNHFDHTDWTIIDAGVPPYIESKTVAERAARDCPRNSRTATAGHWAC